MASRKADNFFYKHPLIIGIPVFLVILLITPRNAFHRHLLNLSEKGNTKALNTVVDQPLFHLNYSFSISRPLTYIVENYGKPQNFNTSNNHKNNSFSPGITGMRERAFTVNGSFHLHK